MKTRGECIKDRLRDRLPLLTMVFFMIQPVLDVAGYWQQTLGIPNTATLLIRMALLAGAVWTGFSLSDSKKVYYCLFGVLACLTLLHAAACMGSPQGYREPVKDLVNLVRIYYLPLMTVSLITCLKQNGKVFPAMLKGAAAACMEIAAVMLLSVLTGTDPHTYNFTLYDTASYGVRGWFLWTNSQSAILSMLCPLVILCGIAGWKGKTLPAAILTAVSEAALFFLGTRLAFGSLIVSGLGSAVCFLVSDRSKKRTAAAILVVTGIFAACFPFSETQKKLGYSDLEREGITAEAEQLSLVKPSESGAQVEETSDETTEETLDKLEALYRSQQFLWSMIERFGRDRVFQAYQYTTDPDVLRLARTKKIVFCRLLMEDSGPMARCFGLNLRDMTYERIDKDGNPVIDNFDVENDFHGIYFLTGIAGLVLMLAFLLYFGVRSLLMVIRQPKTYFTPFLCAFGIAYGLGMIHAVFTAAILRRNNASVYLAMVLAGLWHLSRRTNEDTNRVPHSAKPLSRILPKRGTT